MTEKPTMKIQIVCRKNKLKLLRFHLKKKAKLQIQMAYQLFPMILMILTLSLKVCLVYFGVNIV